MNLVVDMNLSPAWCETLRADGHDARHWSDVGDPRAPDAAIMTWARAHDCLVLTHDLDFGTILAVTNADGPSVIQVRAQDVLPAAMGASVLAALRQFADALAAGALVTIDPHRRRARVLPLRPAPENAQ